VNRQGRASTRLVHRLAKAADSVESAFGYPNWRETRAELNELPLAAKILAKNKGSVNLGIN
jgi:hypothetical protein